MGDIISIEPLLDGVYDAAVDSSRWPVALAQMTAHFGAASAHLSFENVQSTQGEMVSFGTDPAFAPRYAQYYVTRNVLWQEFVRRRLSGVLCDRQIMPKDELRRSEFYNDFLAPQDCDDLLIAPCSRRNDSGATFTLWRPIRRRGWTRGDASQFGVLATHLSRAVRVCRQFGTTEAINAFSAEALYRLGRGLFIVTASGLVLFANETAEKLLGGGLCLHQRRLSAREPAESESLRRLIAVAVAGKTGGGVIVTCTAGIPLLVIVVPVRADRFQAVGGQPGAMVLTRRLGGTAGRPLDAFSSHYGLTPAETRVAQELLVGDGIGGVAKRLKISEATARTHRIRIFQKTHVRRQAELVRVIFEWSDGAFEGA